MQRARDMVRCRSRWCRTRPWACRRPAIGADDRGIRSRPSRACSSRAGPRRAWHPCTTASACSPSSASMIWKSISSRMRRAIFRTTLESSTTRQVFISRPPCLTSGACRPNYAARVVLGTISRTRSMSRTTMSWPSRRWTPPASLAMRGSRLTGFSSRPSSGSCSTSPIWSISRP